MTNDGVMILSGNRAFLGQQCLSFFPLALIRLVF